MKRIAPRHHRKAAIIDALAVALLLAFSAVMGMIALIISTTI